MNKRAALLGIAGFVLVQPALAHHSIAMFDAAKTVTLSGTVRIFQWTNPHSFIQLMVPGATGPLEWSIEMGSPGLLYRGGWRPGTLKPGDKITVVINPNLDRSSGGLLSSAIAADGHQLGNKKLAKPARE
ncbi:MAG TPA: DUF6152 family protein [Steroidobacteraceae bacterium]|nr:DUF6152 family protein [Steroidobacteraceae bacterium]